jgi:hypothetical protein
MMTETLSRSVSQYPPRGEAAYRRGDLFEKRRNLMDAWAPCCFIPAQASQVFSIAKRLTSVAKEDR